MEHQYFMGGAPLKWSTTNSLEVFMYSIREVEKMTGIRRCCISALLRTGLIETVDNLITELGVSSLVKLMNRDISSAIEKVEAAPIQSTPGGSADYAEIKTSSGLWVKVPKAKLESMKSHI